MKIFYIHQIFNYQKKGLDIKSDFRIEFSYTFQSKLNLYKNNQTKLIIERQKIYKNTPPTRYIIYSTVRFHCERRNQTFRVELVPFYMERRRLVGGHSKCIQTRRKGCQNQRINFTLEIRFHNADDSFVIKILRN